MQIEQVHEKPPLKYKQYDHNQLAEAYIAVKDGKIAVGKAARMYAVPMQTLRDRVLGKISIDTVHSGRGPVLSFEEEESIAAQLQHVAKLGYGYTRQEIVDIATDYAVQLGKRTKETPLTMNWFCKFICRWPEVKGLRRKSLEVLRGKSTASTVLSSAVVSDYFEELDRIMTKYDLQDKPHLIFNVDEKGVTEDQTTTIIGGGSASGMAIPPFFVFAGKRLMPELMKGSSPGVKGVMSETGWSDAEIFRKYLQEHFIKFVPQREPGQHLLLVFDGDSSHISVDLTDWAKTQNIILFVLPARTSHVLQPLYVGCYGPFQRIYTKECHKAKRKLATGVTRHDVCGLSCKAYSKALSEKKLCAAFKKSGIFPLDKNIISKETSDDTDTPDDHLDTPDDHLDTPDDHLDTTQATPESAIFTSRIKTIIQADGKKKTRRQIIGRIIVGKAVNKKGTKQKIHHYSPY